MGIQVTLQNGASHAVNVNTQAIYFSSTGVRHLVTFLSFDHHAGRASVKLEENAYGHYAITIKYISYANIIDNFRQGVYIPMNLSNSIYAPKSSGITQPLPTVSQLCVKPPTSTLVPEEPLKSEWQCQSTYDAWTEYDTKYGDW
jgi:hypothetical protein